MHLDKDLLKSSALIVVMIAGYIFGVWVPRDVKDGRLQDRVAKAKAELAQVNARVEDPALLRDQVARLQRESDEEGAFVPETHEMASLLRSLSQRLATRGVQDQSLQTKPIVRGAKYEVIPVSLTFRARSRDVFDVLREVESMNRLIRVTLLEVERDESERRRAGSRTDSDISREDRESMLRVRLEICTFSAPEGIAALVSAEGH